MNGSIRQRSAGSWELRAYVGVDPDTGRRIDRSMTVRGNRAEAERELADMVTRVRCVRAVGSRSTMSELFEAWFATAVDGWSPTTVRQNRSVLDCHLHRHIGSVPVGDVTPVVIDALYAHLRRGDDGARPLAAATVARIHVVLSSAFAQAMRWGWVWDNPAARAHRIVVPTKEMRPPTPGELKALLDYVDRHDGQMALFFTLAAITGARRAQLLGLRWDNISLARRRISFCAGWVEGPDGPVLAATKTKRRHVVDLDLESCYLLADHAAGVSAASSRDAFIFSDDGGATAWKPNRVTKSFLRHRRAAGLAPFRLHDLRHFMATEMLNAGVPIVVVSRRLDHKRVSTTLDRYAHAVPGQDEQASAVLWQIMSTA